MDAKKILLGGSNVSRCGVTARYLNHETSQIWAHKRNDRVCLNFHMDSKGGGVTDVYVEIGPADFRVLLRAMCEVDRQAAIGAMAAELARELPLREPDTLEERRKEADELAEWRKRKAAEKAAAAAAAKA